jgi:hypothetical protein
MKKLNKTQQIKKFRSLLIKACDAHIKAGGTIITVLFTNGSNECCLIQCATRDWRHYEDRLEKLLGFRLSEDVIGDFISAFDGDTYPYSGSSNSLATKLGKELRKKYITE